MASLTVAVACYGCYAGKNGVSTASLAFHRSTILSCAVCAWVWRLYRLLTTLAWYCIGREVVTACHSASRRHVKAQEGWRLRAQIKIETWWDCSAQRAAEIFPLQLLFAVLQESVIAQHRPSWPLFCHFIRFGHTRRCHNAHFCYSCCLRFIGVHRISEHRDLPRPATVVVRHEAGFTDLESFDCLGSS